ncbi:hypothetical protein JG687_00015452 [Phytophthora cactorum]|uniref:Uncharacterized protein n=1 Tax=Phytophthora cactorum TaxID=29920 RepID=A0A8T1TTB8_9STRA|nr:hypothetical protein JG687_00015452 [Phytophthora cactorum]
MILRLHIVIVNVPPSMTALINLPDWKLSKVKCNACINCTQKKNDAATSYFAQNLS